MPILIIAIFIGLLWAFILAPVFIVRNKNFLKTMRGIVDQYESYIKNNPGANPDTSFKVEEVYKDTLKRLYDLKKKIYNGDKKSVEEARDIITLFTSRN